ncbi:MAG: biotin/lipoyl-binding protein, partial [Actinobacteria bacterium]|nr:biotin/lipoyl-binding protein [Actinomycetota bacterium]
MRLVPRKVHLIAATLVRIEALFLAGLAIYLAIRTATSKVEELDAIRRLTHPKLSLSRQITQDRRQRSAAYQQIDPLIQRQLRDKRQELLEREQLLVRLKALWRKGYVSAAQLLQEQSNVIGLRQQVVQLDRDRLGNSFSSTDQRQQATEAELNSLQTTDQLQDALVTYMSRVLTIAPPSGGYLVALYQQNGMQVKQGDELFTYSLKAPELPEVIPVFVDAATVQQLD